MIEIIDTLPAVNNDPQEVAAAGREMTRDTVNEIQTPDGGNLERNVSSGVWLQVITKT